MTMTLTQENITTLKKALEKEAKDIENDIKTVQDIFLGSNSKIDVKLSDSVSGIVTSIPLGELIALLVEEDQKGSQ